MLVTLREVLGDARAKGYAVPAFDFTEDFMVRTILETAEDLRAPVILMTLEVDLNSHGGNGWAYQSGLVRAVADHHRLPIVLHLDHASSLETIQRGLDYGFSSVMFDGSALPLEENVRLTRATVEMAQPLGVSVEAELGLVGGMDLHAEVCADNILTEPAEVTQFVERTGVDALAVSIGTSHGVYRSLPNLNIERLQELNAASRVPLVLHGGSGTPVDQIQAAVRNGICKLNLYADLRIALFRGLQESAATISRIDPLPTEMYAPIKEHLAAVVAEKIRLVGAENRV
jgi:fructose-bisphosphate aldolase, class II